MDERTNGKERRRMDGWMITVGTYLGLFLNIHNVCGNKDQICEQRSSSIFSSSSSPPKAKSKNSCIPIKHWFNQPLLLPATPSNSSSPTSNSAYPKPFKFKLIYKFQALYFALTYRYKIKKQMLR